MHAWDQMREHLHFCILSPVSQTGPTSSHTIYHIQYRRPFGPILCSLTCITVIPWFCKARLTHSHAAFAMALWASFHRNPDIAGLLMGMGITSLHSISFPILPLYRFAHHNLAPHFLSHSAPLSLRSSQPCTPFPFPFCPSITHHITQRKVHKISRNSKL